MKQENVSHPKFTSNSGPLIVIRAPIENRNQWLCGGVMAPATFLHYSRVFPLKPPLTSTEVSMTTIPFQSHRSKSERENE